MKAHERTELSGLAVSRRSFVKTMGLGTSATALLAFDGPRSWARAASMVLPVQERPLLLHNNENPLGPGARVLAAMNDGLEGGPRAGRYPFGDASALGEAIAEIYDIPTDNVMVGNGSTQLLRSATHVFTSPTRPLVTANPSYEEPPGYAALVGHPVISLPLNDRLMLDLDAMADASKGAGMVFLCNPNNPTATLHSADAVGAFIDRILSETQAVVLVDEAYNDYVTDPNHESQIKRAVQEERIIVTRTFSKAHGMAGMRIGWLVAHPDAISKMRRWHYGLSLNMPSLVGATTSIQDPARIVAEAERNTAALRYTTDWFASKGMMATDSQTNFIFVRTGMTSEAFRDGCAQHGVLVGRDFPPYTDVWARISIGTMDEMEQAIPVFDRVLAESTGMPGGRDSEEAA